VTAAGLRRYCLARPGAVEEFPFGPETSVFKVGGKMFALSRLRARPLRVSVKCEPELGQQLRGTYDEIEPGYHLNKRHWVTVTCGGSVPDDLVRELVAGSYDLVAPKRR
jgi:predicted DNA-binding protein (MmcQ/YjbR family)